jgi:hypothetical protein
MMTAKKLYTLLAVLILFAPFCGLLSAQEPSCNEVIVLARMARAQSSLSLNAEKERAGESYRAQVVYATRSFELKPQQHVASLLLSLIPKDEGQQKVWMTFGDSLCSSETLSDMKTLGRLGASLPRRLAKAVLLVPDQLPNYLAYAQISVQNPESDYAVQMEAVCHTKHPEFIRAVEHLPLDRRDWFVKHIFEPESCHALALPEAQ